jgi:DNA-binding CsgD family transcriptional regulator
VIGLREPTASCAASCAASGTAVEDRLTLRGIAVASIESPAAFRDAAAERAVTRWWALVACGWTPVDRFDANGRRFLVACRPVRSGRSRPLSPREHQVVSMAGLGCSNKEIAATMGSALSTVQTHLRRALRKLGVSSRVALAAGSGPPDAPR